MTRRVFPTFSLAAVGLAALAGCSDLSSYSVPHDAARRSPRPGPVAVFASYDPRVGRELGVVVVRGGSDDDVRELFPELVRKVQELGGNALVLDSMGARFDLVSPWATTAYTPYGCGLSCTRWGGPQPPLEVMTVELRGRALLVSPDELARVERGAP